VGHYYNDWRKIVTRDDLLGAINKQNELVDRISGFIGDLHRDVGNVTSETTERLIRKELDVYYVSYREESERLSKLRNLLERCDTGEKIENYYL
jgi:hypothetical protein